VHVARLGLDRVVPREMVINLMPPWAGESLEFLAAVATQSVAESVEQHHRTVVVGEARRAVLEERLGAKGADAWERAHGEHGTDDVPPPPPPSCTERTRLVHPSVLIGHVSSLPPY
jgi:hypothetical protein